MATQTTGGGSTTSFTNTPQAQGDTFFKNEDQTGIFIFDVMLNDLGGTAKILWSLDDGSGLTTELLASDIGEVAATTDDESANGAKIWITNGKVSYDSSTLDATFLAAIQALAVGETITDSFTYAIRLANGTLAWTTATIVYTGSNDAPVISVGGGDSASETLEETNSGLSTSGTLTVTDVDTSDEVDTAVTGVVLSGTAGSLVEADVIGMLTITVGADDLAADTGDTSNLSWAFSSGLVTFDYLADDESLTLTYTLTSTDGNGGSDTQEVTITIEGTNDGPVIVAGGDLDGAVEEESGTYTDSGSFNFTDVDASDVHSVSATPGGLGYLGTFTPTVDDDSTGDGTGTIGWSFSVANAALQFLGEGETRTQTYTVTVDDGNGGTASETVTVVLTGDNDPVEISVGASDSDGEALDETDSGLSTSGTLTVTDIDTIDVIDTSVTGVVLSGNAGSLVEADVIGMLSFTGGTDNDLDADTGDASNLSWAFSSGLVTFDYLADGESLTLTYTLTSSDGEGSTDTQEVAITINGTNDGPTVSATAAQAIVEAADASAQDLSDSGTVSFDDIDANDVVDISAAYDGNLSWSGGAVLPAGLEAALTSGTFAASATDAAAPGSTPWTYTANDVNLDFLADSETLTFSFTVTATDSQGATATDTVTFTITGTNDAPDIFAGALDDAGETFAETDAPLLTSGTLSVVDPDTNDTVDTTVTGVVLSGDTGSLVEADVINMLTITAGGTGLAADAGASGNLSWSFDSTPNAFDYLAAGDSLTLTYTLTSSDGNGGSDTQEVTITINGTNEAPTDVQDPTDIVFTLASTVGALTGTGLAASATLGSFTAVDADSTSWTFALSGANAALFTLSPASGSSVNLVTNAAGIATGQYTINVTATDGGGNSFLETFTVSVGTSGVDGAAVFTVSNNSDVSFGLNGNDTINGGNGEDALVGGQATDSLNGGLGNDQLFGGQGNDNFILNSAIGPAANVDKILDFDAVDGPQSDKIHLDDAIFAGIANVSGTLSAADFAANAGGNATTATQNILFDTSTGNLYYDADGNLAGAKVLIAQITVTNGTVGDVGASDFVVI